MYRMHDANPNGVVPVGAAEAKLWNTPEKGFGIFWSVNAFKSPERRIANLERIAAWAVDMDDGTKAEQTARINSSPLVPSLVVETKRGHQCYWKAKDGNPQHWNAIVLDRLVPFFGADKNARDLARILRAPGFLHLKNPAEPFKCVEVWRHDVSYFERQLAEAFEPIEREEARAEHDQVQREHRAVDGDDFWERVWNLNCEHALDVISGSPMVSGEVFTFKRTGSGTRNILVDGKGTSCWVDKNGRIGSLSKGGPTVYAWLAWYRHRPRDIVEFLKREFPELTEARR